MPTNPMTFMRDSLTSVSSYLPPIMSTTASGFYFSPAVEVLPKDVESPRMRNRNMFLAIKQHPSYLFSLPEIEFLEGISSRVLNEELLGFTEESELRRIFSAVSGNKS